MCGSDLQTLAQLQLINNEGNQSAARQLVRHH